jgi:HK97 family phage prohead protease
MRKLIIGSREYQHLRLKEFADAGFTGDVEPVLRRDFVTEIRTVEGDARALDFIISTASVDRYGDTIALDGWKLANFRKNPVVLWMHDNTMLPVGKASNVRIEDNALRSRVEFTPSGLVRYNDIVLEMLKGGFLSATSVGFSPLKYNFVDDPSRRFGIDFLEQELLEFSIVTVPANAEALIEGRSAADAVAPEAEAGFSLEIAQRRAALARLAAA